MPRTAGRLLASPTPLAPVTAMLASALCSSRSLEAVHSGFTLEQEGDGRREVSGAEGRSAVRLTTGQRTITERPPCGGRNFINGVLWVRQKSMQIKLFTIPVGEGGAAEQELNTFLKANRVLL